MQVDFEGKFMCLITTKLELRFDLYILVCGLMKKEMSYTGLIPCVCSSMQTV